MTAASSSPAPALRIRKAAVLGAGVMGAQIAAHLTNAGVETVLFDLPAKEGPKSGIALKAIANLKKLSPAPLADKNLADAIIPANYDEDMDHLGEVDLVIEAIAERMDWKLDLYRKIAPTCRRARSSPPTPPACRSTPWPRRCPRTCATATAACTSSTRRATCTWSS
jgi:3-hydroxyacyl-CoA dehydrogenase